ncbi:beta strand repeat-containing protein [Chromobacterium violaceum]|uniref:beta strand repeat-containing protein n=1 Tax=Chromobacterium violaceum TaxID=536 RepID=UPI003DA82121
MGNVVSNQGTIEATAGTVALAGGSEIAVGFADNQLVSIQVNKSTLNNFAENQQLIQADGGQVIMTAGAHDSILGSAVNNSGIIEARTLESHNGKITLLAGMAAGTTSVAGTLDASAPDGGDGGHIDTSGAHVKIAPDANISTKASNGSTGSWTIDPQNYTIAASGGDITGSQVSSLLGSNNITISSTQGAVAGSGDLNVNDAISWSNANSLTLTAVRNVSFNSGGTVTNTGGGTLSARADANASGTGTVVMNGGSINVSGAGGAVNFYYNPAVFGTPSTFSNVTVSGGSKFTPYMLINTASKLQSMSTNASANYALATNIDASSISNFTPVAFSGNFDGLNYAINNLTINASGNNAGLFSTTSGTATVQNLSLANASVTGHATVGALVGNNAGTIKNVTVSGTVSGTNTEIGGVAGYNTGSLDRVTSSATVNGTGISGASDYVGGLIGYSTGGSISNASVSGAVNVAAHNYYIGGLIGYSNSTISNSAATGNVNAVFGGYTGGFIGYAAGGTVSASYATGSVTAGDYGYDDNAGFIGVNYAPITNSYSTGTVTLAQSWYSGGLVGQNHANIGNSYSSSNITVSSGPAAGGDGSATYTNSVGGLVGYNVAGNLSNVYATGNVISTGQGANGTYYGSYYIGGLVGYVGSGNITHSYATGNVTATALIQGAGGLVGEAVAGTYTNDYASGNVTATQAGYSSAPTYVGGLIGYPGATLVNTYSVGNVSVSSGTTNYGGLTGAATTITGSSFWDTTTSGRATDPSTHAVGMNTTNMQTQANFTSATTANGNTNPAWDFSTVWKMGTGAYLYPVFQTANGPTSTPGPTTPVVAAVYYPLTLSNFSASNKVYDGTAAASGITANLAGILPGQTVGLSSLSGNFVDKNVGNGKTITLNSTPTLAGANAGNYLLAPYVVNAFSANITPLAITVSAAGQNKTYDGTVHDTVTLSSSGVLAGDTVNFSDTSATFANKNVGNAKTVSVSGISASGADAGNYTLNNNTATTSANITPLVITVSATGQNKTYDATVNDAVTLSSSGVLAGDTVNFADTSATFANKNVGNAKTVSVSGISASGADAGNYTLNNNTATTSANITPLAITVNATGQNKTYDATVNASVTLSSSGVLAGDTVNFSDTSAAFANKNVGNAKPVSVAGISASGADAGNYTLNNNTATTSANITPLAITVSATGQNKTYDATVNASVTLSSSGVLAGDTVNFADTSATFANKNVGNAKTVSVSGISASGADTGNYTINSTATTSANIAPLAITVSATGQNKTYDGTVNDAVTLSSSGVLAGDAVNFADTSATFANKNVGNAKTVSVSGISASGADAGNYTLNNNTATTSANITPLAITVSATGQNKTYDATVNASVTLSSSGVLAGDAVNFSDTSAAFANKNVGTAKPVSVAGISASGADAGNYTLNNNTATTSANITPLAITVNATGQNKTYDGTVNDTVTLSSSSVLAGDTVNFSDTSATFANKNVGNAKTVSVSGISASGADAGNYTINSTATTSANITPLAITVSATGQNKTYDATVNGTVTLSSSGVLAGDAVSFSDTSATFNNKNIGTAKPVSVTGISASGADAGNYTLNNSTATTSANITPLALSVNGAGAFDKLYDGTNAATLYGSIGTLGSDAVTLSGNGTFASAHVAHDGNGNGNVIAQSVAANYAISGADAGNYTLTQPTGLAAAIRPVTVTANISAANKTYDGTTSATLTSQTVAGTINGETLALNAAAANFDTKDAGTGKTVTASGLTLSNGTGLASDYALQSNTAATTANINQAHLTISGLAASDKTYDGTTGVTITNWGNLNGLVSGETLTLNHGNATFGSAASNAGTLTVTASGYSLANGSGKASNYILDTPTATTQAAINKALLTITANNDAKIVTQADNAGSYNGVSYSGFVNGETASVLTGSLSVSRSGMGAGNGVGDPAGSYANSLVASGLSAANYAIAYQPGNYTIVPANVLLVKAANVSQAYGSAFNLAPPTAQYLDGASNLIKTLTVTANGGNNFSASDGAGGSVTFTLAPSGGAYSGSNNLSLGNYNLASSNAHITGSNFNSLVYTGVETVTPKALTPSAISGVSKTYDATTAMNGLSLTGGSGLITGDAVTISGSGAFASANAGSEGYTVNNLTLSGHDAADYYVTNAGTLTGTGTINARHITLNAQSDAKTYDGTTSSTQNVAIGGSGLVGSDSISGLAEQFNSKNALGANGSTLSVKAGYAVNDGNGGNNYIVDALNTASGTINKAALTLSAQKDVKTYDGTASSSGTVLLTGGLVGGDSFSTLSQSFDSKNAGSRTLNVNYAINDGNGGNNYQVATLAASGAIAQKILTAPSLSINNKVYDGTTSASINASGGALNGVLGGDSVNIDTSRGVASFSTKNVGANLAVTIGSVGLSGADAGNYTINNIATARANITPLAITVGATGQNKIYDGTVNDTVTLSSSGVLAGDAVNFADTSATFANKNVGNGKTVTVTGITASGSDAGNYTLNNDTAITSASITPRTLTVSATGQNKIYDGTVNDAVTLASSGVLPGDIVNISAAGASFLDKNVGKDKIVTVAGISASGADAGNYAIANSVTTTASITPITLYYFSQAQGIKQGQTPYNLIGEIRGDFANGENLSNATYGALRWITNGNAYSAVGQYAIMGSGLSAQNYIFIQDPSNATALTISPNQVPFITQTQNDVTAQILALAANGQASSTPYGLTTKPFATGNVAANRKYHGDNNTGLSGFETVLNLDVIDGGVKLSTDRKTLGGGN